VYDNMAFSLKLAGRPDAEVRSRVAEATQILGLDDYLKRYPRHLSGGQRQRVAMGRAIVRNPAVFLFDEPLSNLDAQLRDEMRSEIKRLHQELGKTMIYVTHDQVEAMTMADRIAVMNDGRIEQLGRPLELYDRPANLFVAQFIGSPAMNIVEGIFKNNSVEALGVRWPVPPGTSVREGQSVKYGIRPVHFDLGSGISAEVVVVEPMGAETELVVKIGGQSLIVVTHGRSSVGPGDRLALAPNGKYAHLFDAASGARL
jgi:multiple sugar transport system ATP-binding protein